MTKKSGRSDNAIKTPLPILSPVRGFVFSHKSVFWVFCLHLPENTRQDFEGGIIDNWSENNGFSADVWGMIKSWTIKEEEEIPICTEYFDSVFDIAPSASEESITLFSSLVTLGEVKIWGRWASRKADFEPIPSDAWPHRPNQAIQAGLLDIDAGSLTLDSGETIYSIHFEDPLRPQRLDIWRNVLSDSETLKKKDRPSRQTNNRSRDAFGRRDRKNHLGFPPENEPIRTNSSRNLASRWASLNVASSASA